MCAVDCRDGARRDALLERTLENRLLILPSGESSVRFRPALTLSSEEAAEGIERLAKSVSGSADSLS